MASVKTHLNNLSVIVSAKNWEYIYLYTFMHAKNLFKMPNMHFKSQIYRFYFRTVLSA